MAVSGAITIGGGSAPVHFAFTATGTATLAYAQAFSNAVDTAFTNGTYNIVNLDTPPAGHVPPPGAPVLTFYDFSNGGSYTIPAGGGYLLDSVNGATTVTGSSEGGDNVLIAGINGGGTYLSEGGDNTVIFINGNNTYDGTADSVGGDTVVAGSGFDTVNTGTAPTTVYSGTGDATIYLNDTGSTASEDKVWIHDGSNTIYANGTNDAVGIDANSAQTIYGGSNAASYLSVLLSPTSGSDGNGAVAGNNVIIAGAGTTSVFDQSSGNSIFGGSGALYLVSGADVTASVVAGTGVAYVFGDSGDSISFANNTADTAQTYFVAGGGSETYSGGDGTVKQYIYGYSSSVSSGINESLTGGNGPNVFVAGNGSETLTGGTGLNEYVIDANATGADTTAGANILLADFGTTGSSLVDFTGFQSSDLANAINNGVAGTITVGGESYQDYQITFNDGTEVTFVGINSASELNNKIV